MRTIPAKTGNRTPKIVGYAQYLESSHCTIKIINGMFHPLIAWLSIQICGKFY